MDKKEIAAILEKIGVILEIRGDNPFKCRAYINAARTIENLDEDILLIVQENRLKSIKGIGETLAEKIAELVKIGKMKYYQELIQSTPSGLFDMLLIPGMGPKKVKAVSLLSG